MSNKRRKTIGQQKLRRNWLIRVTRGNTISPGHGRWRDEYTTATETTVNNATVMMGCYSGIVLKDHTQIIRQTEQLRNDIANLVTPYWRGTNQ